MSNLLPQGSSAEPSCTLCQMLRMFNLLLNYRITCSQQVFKLHHDLDFLILTLIESSCRGDEGVFTIRAGIGSPWIYFFSLFETGSYRLVAEC